MYARIERLSELITPKVAYYSLSIYSDEDEEDAPITLFEHFIQANQQIPSLAHDLAVVVMWLITRLGREFGAKEEYFRHERKASALPPPAKYIKSTPVRLRLYCYRVNEAIVILFDGAEKTKDDPEACPNVRPHFRMANRLSEKLDRAFREGDIWISDDGRRLAYEDTFELEL